MCVCGTWRTYPVTDLSSLSLSLSPPALHRFRPIQNVKVPSTVNASSILFLCFYFAFPLFRFFSCFRLASDLVFVIFVFLIFKYPFHRIVVVVDNLLLSCRGLPLTSDKFMNVNIIVNQFLMHCAICTLELGKALKRHLEILCLISN